MPDDVQKLIGPEGSEKLILADSETWLEDESIQIACDDGWVDLDEMR